MIRLLLLFGFLLLAPPVAAQDVVVRAVVDETTVGDEEVLAYSIQIEGATPSDIETPEPPSATGLILVQRTPSTQRSMTIINGHLEQSVSFRWNFRPVRQGKARIDPATVVIAGTSYRTKAIEISVVDQANRPRPTARQRWPFVLPSQPQPDDENRDITKRDLFIRAVPSATTARQNEQVTVEYQLYFRDGIQLRHSRLAGSWDAEGFWREEFNVDTRPIPRSVVENGILYHMIVLKRAAVFPTHPGTLTIDPLEIETEAYFPPGSSDPFERFFSLSNRFETVELASEPVRIDVQPLPEGAPDVFEGAVGRYDLAAEISSRSVEVGEPIELTITLRGAGNLATLALPQIRPPGIFEQYDPNVQTDIDRDGEQIRGTKTVSHVLVPRSNGRFEMPPVRFAYYDPSGQRYVTLEAELPAVTVTGTAAPLAAGTTTDGLPVDDIAANLTTGEWMPLQDRPLHRRMWPYLALLVPALLLAAMFIHQRRRHRLATDPEFARSRMAHPLARKHLQEARRLLDNRRPRAFYEEIERAVTGFIGNRLNISELGLTRDQLEHRLEEAGVDAEVRSQLRWLLDECDQARFAPVLPDRDAMMSAGERAAQIILAVDESAQQSSSARAA